MTLFFGDSTFDKPYLDGSGRPLAGAVLTFFLSGTTALAPVYGSDGFEIDPPYTLDEDGVAPELYLDPDLTYRVLLKDSKGRLVFDVDPYLTDSSLFLSPVYHAVVDDSPVAGASLAFFALDGVTPKDTYADGDELAEHPNPIRADAGGHFPPIYLQTVETPGDVYQVVPSYDPDDPLFDPPTGPRVVAVADSGSSGRIAISDDGDVWEAATTVPDGEWNDVDYALEIDTFVAVGNDGQIIRSTDGGETWALCDVPTLTFDDWISVIWIPGVGDNEGRFVAGQNHASSVSANDSFVYSDDGGETWSATGDELGVTFQTQQFAYHDGILIAAGLTAVGSANIAKSVNGGAAWSSLVEGVTGQALGVVYSTILETFLSGDNEEIVASVDGESWDAFASANVRKLYEFPEWDRLFTIVPGTGIVASSDGENWTAIFAENLTGIASSRVGGFLIAVGLPTGNDDVFFKSENVTDWTVATTQPASANWQAVAAGLRLIPGEDLPVPATPAITSLDPSTVNQNSGAFTLTVNGTDFLPSTHDDASVVQWDGSDRVTTFVSTTELQAAILETDVEDSGTVEVTVANSDRVSDPAEFTIEVDNSDPDFDDVTLLLHMDGTDGATSFPDASNSAHTVTANGGAQVDTAQKKYGTGALLLDGNGDYLSAPGDADFAFGTGDFTVELWIRFASVSGAQAIVGTYSGATTGWMVQKRNDNTLRLFKGDTSLLSGAWTPSTATWYHVAISRASDVLRAFVDGTQVGSDVANSTDLSDLTALHIGRLNLSGGTQYVNGAIDDLRITKGVGRYTENFTPPAAAFPDE